MFRLFLIFTFVTSSPVLSLNRVLAPNADANVRCSEKKPTVDESRRERAYARQVGCISQEEFDSLVRYEGYPVCDRHNEFLGWCPTGCFVRGTNILVKDKRTGRTVYHPVEEVVGERNRFMVWALIDTMNGFVFSPREIRVATMGPEDEAIVYVLLSDGSKIGLTAEHGVLLANRTVVPARKLVAGMGVFNQTGHEIIVEDIVKEKTQDDVFNILVDSDGEVLNHFIIANGIICGDLAWQGSLSEKMSSFVLGQ